MRQLFRFRATRTLCCALIVALVATIAPMPLSKQAQAQLMSQYAVGVVDFVNESGVQGELLARLATDAVVVEMSKTDRYAINATRSQIKEQMEKLDLRPPLTRLGLVRLGDAITADAMLQGAVKSVQLTGSGATRKAAVTLVVELVDQASGETVNGAVQTGSSSARVGYTADDESLINEAINNAAYLVVKTMAEYIIPEATVQMSIGSDQLMLNKGARDGLKPGMNMIILRQKEIIGYIRITSTDPTDSYAKITRSTRGVQPEDKVRAIFQMPTVSAALQSEPLPSAAPKGGRGGRGALGGIGKAFVAVLVIGGLAALFSGGRGGESAQKAKAGDPMAISWDPTKYTHGQPVMEVQILRDGVVFKTLRSPTAIDSPPTSLLSTIDGLPYYGTGGATYTISYYRLDANPSTTAPTDTEVTVNQEPFGTTHQYNIRVVYRQDPAPGTAGTTKYFYTPLSNAIVATAIERVRTSDVIGPLAYDSGVGPTEVLVSRIASGLDKFEWNRKDGADVYQMSVRPAPGNHGPTWTSTLVYSTGGPVITLPTSQQNALAALLSNPAFTDQNIIWRVDCRNLGDTSQAWVKGEDNWLKIVGVPPGP